MPQVALVVHRALLIVLEWKENLNSQYLNIRDLMSTVLLLSFNDRFHTSMCASSEHADPVGDISPNEKVPVTSCILLFMF